MKTLAPALWGLSLALAGSTLAAAQDAATATPPKVLQITREWMKPGKVGMVHDQSESAFVSLVNKAKLQGHYVALNSMSGKSRALYVTQYPTFEAWEKDNKAVEKNPAFAAEFDRAVMNDGELLESLDQGLFVYDEELSYHPHPDLSHARYFEITVFHVKLGHRKDWADVTKMYKGICDKANSTAHWATYEASFGADEGTFLAITARSSLAEVDQGMAEFKKFIEAAGGEDGMNQLDQKYAAAVESARTELFSINPRQSYADEAWVKADPDFWKPKSTPLAKTAAPKPAAPAASKPSSR